MVRAEIAQTCVNLQAPLKWVHSYLDMSDHLVSAHIHVDRYSRTLLRCSCTELVRKSGCCDIH